MSPTLKFVTIGVYGFKEEDFFLTLREAGVDTFVDIRNRRGMRGSRYAFANSARLQARLQELGIVYRHEKGLSPPVEIRAIQKEADKKQALLKRERVQLSPEFVYKFQKEVLANFDFDEFLKRLPAGSKIVALFCVEHEPQACHRSLVAKHLADQYDYTIEDLLLWRS